MGVEGTPVGIPAVNEALAVRTVPTTTIYGEATRGRRRAVKVKQSSIETIEMELRDSSNIPIDLSALLIDNDPVTVSVRFCEATNPTIYLGEAQATLSSPEQGIVVTAVPVGISDTTGIYVAEFGVLSSASRLVYSNNLYVFVESSAWGNSVTSALPSEEEIRMSLRDNDAAENELIANTDFDLAEICYAATRSVLDWNEMPPLLLGYVFSTKNFPMRHIWMQGIHLYLFQVAEEHYRRNHLPYSAGGISLDDKNRHSLYNQAWKEREMAWRRSIQSNKVALNISGGFRSIGSGYPH